jgi:hypothetical protein
MKGECRYALILRVDLLEEAPDAKAAKSAQWYRDERAGMARPTFHRARLARPMLSMMSGPLRNRLETTSWSEIYSVGEINSILSVNAHSTLPA